jgi:hypothetical protein
MDITREQRVIWAAGFFDGEGCISIHEYSQGTQLRLIVAQKDPAPILVWKEIFPEGNIHATNGGKYCKWQLTGHKCVPVLNELLPYLINKKPQAEIAVRWSVMNRLERHEAYVEVKRLKTVDSEVRI